MTPQKLEEASRRIVEASDPLKIILFGSRARGDAGEESDADLLVVEAEVNNPIAESGGKCRVRPPYGPAITARIAPACRNPDG